MADLKTDYKDDILDTDVNTNRKYQMIDNGDGTVSFVDVTTYTQQGDGYGAAQINEQNTVINQINNDLSDANTDITALKNRLEVKNFYSVNNTVDVSSNIAFSNLQNHTIMGFKSAGNMLATWGSVNGTPYVHLTDYQGNNIAQGTNVGALTLYYI